jgi:uncharacterized protein
MGGLIQPTVTPAMHLAHIYLYPIKSLDGLSVPEATILPSGALRGDREWAIVDQQGKFVNGKRTAKIHKLRSQFDLGAGTIAIRVQGNSQPETFSLESDRPALESWLSQFFGFAVQLVQNSEVGFPDDLESPGPTVISSETLQTVAAWFPGLDLEQTRSRFRTNLEIADVEPFWEDRLFGADDRLIPFQIGEVELGGVNPCQRCVVPTRDPITGEKTEQFQQQFVQKRQKALPEWAERSRFNHFFRLAVNTRLTAAQAGKVLRIGDLGQITT